MTKELVLQQLEFGKEQLVRTFSAVPDDKLTWKPLDNGRTALDLFSEAAQTAGFLNFVLLPEAERPAIQEMFGSMRQQRADWNKADALDWMQTNHDALIKQIEGLTEEQLNQPVTLTLRGETTRTLASWAMIIYRAYVSRFAQINYIQTLYGDFDIH